MFSLSDLSTPRLHPRGCTHYTERLQNICVLHAASTLVTHNVSEIAMFRDLDSLLSRPALPWFITHCQLSSRDTPNM